MRFSFHQWHGVGSLLACRAGLTLGPAGGRCEVLEPQWGLVFIFPVCNHCGSHIGTYGSWHGSDVFANLVPLFLPFEGAHIPFTTFTPRTLPELQLAPFCLSLAAILLCILASASGYLLRNKSSLCQSFTPLSLKLADLFARSPHPPQK